MYESTDHKSGTVFSPYDGQSHHVEVVFNEDIIPINTISNDVADRILSLQDGDAVHPSVPISAFFTDRLSTDFIDGFLKGFILSEVLKDREAHLVVREKKMSPEERAKKIAEIQERFGKSGR